MKKGLGFYAFIIIAIILTIMFLLGQTLAVFDHDLTVKMGLQESVAEVGEVGVAFAQGFGFGDTVIYIPLLVLGIIGLIKGRAWGVYSMFGAMAITVYWPLVHLYAITVGEEAINLSREKEITFYVVLSLIILYGLWGMWYLYKSHLTRNT